MMQVLELQVPPFPMLATVGHAVWQPGMIHAQRQFDVFDLLICRSGVLYIEEDGISYELSRGKILVLEPGKVHEGYHPTEVESEVYWVHFIYPAPVHAIPIEKMNGSHPLPRGSDQDTDPQPATVHIPKFAAVDLRPLIPLLDRMVELHKVLIRQHSFELHALLGQLLVQLQNGMRENMQTRSYFLSEKAAAYIENQLELPFDSARMERELHFHFDYLARCLKQHTGMSPIQYRHHLQIERAKRLLSHSELSLKEIASQCGLDDNNYFTKLFKKKTTMTPGEYRKRHQVFRATTINFQP